MKRFYFLLPAVVLVLSTLFCGCRTTSNQADYDTASTVVGHSVETGQILDIHDVLLEDEPAAPAETPSSTSASRTSILGGITSKIRKSLEVATPAEELTIQTEEGEVMVVVQVPRKPAFNIGDKVKIYRNIGGKAIVYHFEENPYVDPDTQVYLGENFSKP